MGPIRALSNQMEAYLFEFRHHLTRLQQRKQWAGWPPQMKAEASTFTAIQVRVAGPKMYCQRTKLTRRMHCLSSNDMHHRTFKFCRERLRPFCGIAIFSSLLFTQSSLP
jgi:hypothetical protein